MAVAVQFVGAGCVCSDLWALNLGTLFSFQLTLHSDSTFDNAPRVVTCVFMMRRRRTCVPVRAFCYYNRMCGAGSMPAGQHAEEQEVACHR